MFLTEKIMNVKEDISIDIYAKAIYISNYLYIEDTNCPEVIVEGQDLLRIRYSDGEKELNIDINGDTSYDNLYLYVNQTKLFYNPRTKNVCLFTGAFNPPTIAHYHMIEETMKAYPFDYIIFAISNQEFLDRKQKRNKDWAFSENERLFMLTAMTRSLKNVLIYGVEHGYTYDTLCQVRDTYHPDNLFFALGSDKLNEIGRWGHHNELLKEFCFYVLNREFDYNGVAKKSEELFKNTQFIVGEDDERFKNISATEVRRAIDNKENFEELVHPNVFNTLLERMENDEV